MRHPTPARRRANGETVTLQPRRPDQLATGNQVALALPDALDPDWVDGLITVRDAPQERDGSVRLLGTLRGADVERALPEDAPVWVAVTLREEHDEVTYTLMTRGQVPYATGPSWPRGRRLPGSPRPRHAAATRLPCRA